MVFLANSDSALQKSEYLFSFNHVEVPDLAAFESLGFPLKQTVRVSLTDNQKEEESKEKDMQAQLWGSQTEQ